MKKILLIIILICLSHYLYSQGWINASVKGGYGVSFLFNKNITNDRNVSPELSYGNLIGGKIAYNFNEYHELGVEVLVSEHNQNYMIQPDSLSFDKSILFSTLDIPLLYRHHSEGGYFEIGPQFSKITKASESISVNSSNNDITKNLVPNYISAVIGFGANFIGSDIFSLIIGFRFIYGLSDIISEDGGKTQTTSYPLNDSFYEAEYTSYKQTNPFSALIIAELNFDLGYFANSKCGKRTKFITF